MANNEQSIWHPQVISPSAKTTTELALLALRDAKLLEGFYLAGGTGLALQFGHRLSRDLDFFSQELFGEEAYLQRLMALGDLSLSAKAPHTLHAAILGTKTSFIAYSYPILFPAKNYLEVAVADARDIACMKLSAIAGRGAKRDFVDLYVCARSYGLKEILAFFDRKYAQAQVNRIHVLKSMTYFADAEKDPMPHMLDAIEWETIKRYFMQEVPRLL
jgi:hypothetical protein